MWDGVESKEIIINDLLIKYNLLYFINLYNIINII